MISPQEKLFYEIRINSKPQKISSYKCYYHKIYGVNEQLGDKNIQINRNENLQYLFEWSSHWKSLAHMGICTG